MAQVSWRADDELVDRAKARARSLHRSLNDYLSLIVDAATDPDLAGTDAEQIRERLAMAGLLEDVSATGSLPPRPTPAEVRAAGRRAAKGVSVADLIIADRE